ncbi:glyoxalase [Planctomonas sp. JC2975]|uniref:glyoxalase superfamily protein n=1 Tax=Planctomonas sp. JC2975 TaxID=2729626 RepID=UPI001475321A|nr:glyoxalase superfamily protein [Planctomonas sp. JC2975]NNC11402.1 glyoxalase [Planctomonas sp. JC2975]
MAATEPDRAKAMARRLRARMDADGIPITHSHALELVAAALGHRDWNTAAAALSAETRAASTDSENRETDATPSVSHPVTVPILRTFPGEEAERFYVGYLGFQLDWEHRFDDGMPLYRQVSREGCVLHLSEHHGDATPGSAVRIRVADVHALQRRLEADPLYPLRIGVTVQEWGADLVVPDPFGNRLVFHTP